MGGIVNTAGQMLGMGGGSGGTGFSPSAGTSGEQLQTAWQGSQDAMKSQGDLLAALQGQNGLQSQNNVYSQLQGVAAGQGPNPAQAMLNQATSQNVANQASLMAGQRGASANPALIARQAAMQGANTQQQAAGQGATMQAQQSLNALSAAGNQANMMAGNQIAQTNQNSASQQGEQGILQGANSNYSNNQTTLANTRMGQQADAIGGLMDKTLGGMGALFGATGGEVPQVANGARSAIGRYLAGFADGGDVGQNMMQSALNTSAQQAATPVPQKQKKSGGGGGDMMDMASLAAMSSGGDIGSRLKSGGHVPGQAKVAGDNLKNDTVHAMLSPGEVVIPRSVMNSKDPARGAADFVAQVMAKKRMKK